MSKKKNQEIQAYISKMICSQLQYLLTTKFKPDKSFNVVRQSMKIQFYYDETFNRVYITYELSDFLRYGTTLPWNYICKYINRSLTNNMHRDTRIFPNMIGPTVKIYYDNEISNRLDFSDNYIRPNTYSVWKITDGTYKFIESPSADKYIQGYLLGLNDSTIYSKYCEELLKFNADNIVGVENIDKLEVFNKYAEIFKKYFNRQLEPIPDSDIVRFYIEDVDTYDVKKLEKPGVHWDIDE